MITLMQSSDFTHKNCAFGKKKKIDSLPQLVFRKIYRETWIPLMSCVTLQ